MAGYYQASVGLGLPRVAVAQGVEPGHAWLNCRQPFRAEWAHPAACSARKHAPAPNSSVYLVDFMEFDGLFPASRHCHHFAVR
jgi:glyoxylate carboligase